MKFSLHNTLDDKHLRTADEISIKYKDRQQVITYIEKYPMVKSFMIEILPNIEWNFEEVKRCFLFCPQKIKFCLPNLDPQTIAPFIENKIPYFWGYTITNAYELNGVYKLGVCAARIGAPLFFDTETLKNYNNISLRLTPNVASDGYITTLNSLIGSWVRPEDLYLYDNIIDIVEFSDCNKNKEQTLYNLYANKKKWAGKLNDLITNINVSDEVYNNDIPEEFAKNRLTCKQKCLTGSHCQICERSIHIAKLKRALKERL